MLSVCRADYDSNGQDALIVNVTLGELDRLSLSPIALPLLEDARLHVMEQAIAVSPSDRSSLEQWALWLHMSPRTLTRLIRDHANLTFGQWRDQMCTFAAIPLLSEGQPLAEIADAVGFDTASASPRCSSE